MKTLTLPSELTEREQWILWRQEQRDGKPTKVPYSARGGRASSTDPDTWATYRDAVEAATQGNYDGIGYVFAEEAPLCGIDLDHCRDPESGKLAAWAREVVQDLDSYTEVSPSGSGLHIIIEARKPGDNCRTADLPWQDVADGAHIELYDSGRYFTVTGDRLEDTPEAPCQRQAELEKLYYTVWPPDSAGDTPPTQNNDLRLSDRELLDKARAADNGGKFAALWRGERNGYASHSEADLALCGLLAFWTGGDRRRIDRLFRQSGLCRDKWVERPDYREKTIDKALERKTDFYDPQKNRNSALKGGLSEENTAIENGDDRTIAQKLLALAEKCDFFKAYPERVFAVPPGRRAVELTERGGGFRRWLRTQYLDTYDKPPRATDVSDVVRALAARTQFEGAKRKVFQRVAYQDGVLYVDLAGGKPRALRVASDGVSIVTEAPVHFAESPIMAELPEPDLAAGPEALAELHDLLGWPAEDTFLATAWLLTAWQPPAPYPVMMLDGPPGAGKSTTAALLRYLSDPAGESGKLLAKRPHDGGDLAAGTAGVHVLALENLSSLPEWMSDHLAALATGSAHVARKLYTNFGVALLERKMPIVLNGICPDGIGGDLRDRMFPLVLSKPNNRKNEKAMWEKIEELRPRVLGALAHCCRVALQNRQAVEIPPERIPRMADAAEWVTAAEPALHEVPAWADLNFIDVLKEHQQADSEASLEADPVAAALLDFLKQHGELRGTATEIRERLEGMTPKVEMHKKRGAWPKASGGAFGRHLAKIQPQLEAVGVICGKPDRRRRRTYTLENE